LTAENSAHTGGYYSDTTKNINNIRNTIGLYSMFKNFDKIINPNYNPNGHGLMTTHSFPDWKNIRLNSNFSETKFIIVTVNEADLLEICTNIFFKNTMDKLNPDTPDTEMPWPIWIHSMYENLIGPCNREDLYNLLLVEEHSKKIIKESMIQMFYMTPSDTVDEEVKIEFYHNKQFLEENINLSIPDDFKQQTLVISYNDLFTANDTNHYVALDQLLFFAGLDSSHVLPETLTKYHQYVIGRNNLVDTYVNN